MPSPRSALRGSALLLLALLLACGGSAPRPMDTSLRPVPRRSQPRVKQILVVALDGATWRILGPLVQSGRTPNLARLAREGVWAELATLEPTVSPAIWTTIATGMLPERHGILGFDGVPGETMKTLPNAGMRKVKAWWEIFDDAGLTSGTIGWWASWPADPLGDGSYLVSDRVTYTRFEEVVHESSLDAHDAEPPFLLPEVLSLVERPEEIDRKVVRFFLGVDDAQTERLLTRDYRMGDPFQEFVYVYQSDRSTFKIAKRMLAEQPVDVASVYFTGIDTLSHLFWHWAFPEEFPKLDIPEAQVDRFGHVIDKYYVLMDRYIGELLEIMGGDTTVIVVSDHGFGGTGRLPWSGGHGRLTEGAPIAPPGVLILSGPGIAGGGRKIEANVLDLAPTLLTLEGLPAARDMRGRVLTQALASGPRGIPRRIASWEMAGHVREVTAPPVDPEGDAERIERLRALGYIE
jgi:arylsulfatase A-like enzyme